jgi:bifunctional DNA-binding transcriptional regulator/antitoxin component of YhaV-PrlF toxin-antitoxin module
MLKILDWEEGTVLCWEITTDNKIVLKKKIDDEDRDEDNGL